MRISQCSSYKALADLRGGARDAHSSLGAQILSISCSFWEKLAKSYVGAPPPGNWRPLLGEILDPPLQGACEILYISHLNYHYQLFHAEHYVLSRTIAFFKIINITTAEVLVYLVCVIDFAFVSVPTS